MEPCFLDLAKQRVSCRQFDPARPVPRPLLRECFETARLAPSACNRQPWRFVVVDAPDRVRAIREQCRVPPLAHTWWDTVPVFVAVCLETSIVTHRIAPACSGIPYHFVDAGIAGEHFVLAAAEQGLASCWIGWFGSRALKRLLRIPRPVTVAALVAVGYPATDGARDRETTRKSLGEIVFWNGWQAPEES
jgi:nitroreductase